jgi:hypothetical protein
VTRYAHKLTAPQIAAILGETQAQSSGGGYGRSRGNDPFRYWGEETLPFAQYDDYSLLYQAQEYTGVPAGEYHSFQDGGEGGAPRFLPPPDRFGQGQGYHARASMLREDMEPGPDLVQVTEAYWVSWKQLFCIVWQQDDGQIVQDIVTDDLVHDFLKEKGIKKLTRSLDAYRHITDPSYRTGDLRSRRSETPDALNTYITAWVPEVRYGVKACTSATGLREDVYLYGDPVEIQVRGDSNLFDVKLPVSGIVGHSLAEKLYPYQAAYNLVMNQMYNLLEKEIGVFFLFDVNFIPSEFKTAGTELKNFMLNVMDVAKSIGLLATDMSKSNLAQQGGGNYFNQFQRVDLSNTQMIASRIQVADWLYSKALSTIGLTPQALGAPVNYQTSTGVKEGLNSSMVQLQPWFDAFELFKQRDWHIHLAVAQHCQREEKDISVFYTQSDLSSAFLRVADEDLSLRHFSILATAGSRQRRELESFKNFLLQNNTMGLDELGLARIWTSDSMTKLLEAARNSREYREETAQRQNGQQLEIQRRNQVFEEAVDRREHAQQMDIEHTRGQYRIEAERIQALGRAADKHADTQWHDWVNESADRAFAQSENDKKRVLEQEKIEQKIRVQDDKKDHDEKELNFRRQELEERRKERESRERIAAMNKN